VKLSRPLLATLVALIAFASLGMAKKKYEVTVRFYGEANANDSERFAKPIKLTNPARDAFIQQIPAISERNIKAIYPFAADDNSMGCAFLLDESGRIGLEVLSSDQRGKSVVAFVSSTKTKYTHQVIDMVIDKPVKDGIISIPRGLTDLEVDAMRKQWRVLGDPNDKRR